MLVEVTEPRCKGTCLVPPRGLNKCKFNLEKPYSHSEFQIYNYEGDTVPRFSVACGGS